ncbi:hypothetical protein RS130_06415 [Paraglaciecola aquimarina]|uniref:Uncharacterized protein n=1 Tax=Paraglaciecola aquimarina TaxID=1235557 RepID=A0ABU3SUB6_9ALTE|nr:hypothetical protein [Paraglaciecola aquimarina]MDU0353609.1 hypothetical protein [Paraglaciecola aquimarina]
MDSEYLFNSGLPSNGNSIKQVEVNEQGQLSVVLGHQSITVLSDEENLEEIWSVTPDDYSQFKEYEWFVTYTDNNALLTK